MINPDKTVGKEPKSPIRVGKLNQNDPRPLYIKIKQYIYDRIGTSDWLPESKIPSEMKLVEELGASRMTINRAIKELVGEGHLMRLPGVGTFVAKPNPRFAYFEVKDIVEEIKESGGIHKSVVFLLEEEKASSVVADSLEIVTGSRVYHSIIAHYDREYPVQLSDQYVNASLVPEYLSQDFNEISPYQYLLSNLVLTEVDQYLEAILPDKETQDILQVKNLEPCLSLKRRTFCLKKISTFSQYIYAGMRFNLGDRINVSGQYNSLKEIAY